MKRFSTILIVDDDPISNYMTHYFLERLNICDSISFAKNGKEALRFLNKNSFNPPELILLDIEMPVMGGFEFLDTLHKNGFDRIKTQIVLYTIHGQKFLLEKEKYNIEMIDKPLTLEKFYDAVGIRSAVNI
jgi:CheY-like chemotaxis protein